MPIPNQDTQRSDAINRLAAEANLCDVAEWLDMKVIGKGTASPKTQCPFHDDKRPSMHLYSASGLKRGQYHCFACGAHGDVFDLIKRRLNKDFRGSLEWLADRYHFSIPTRTPQELRERFDSRLLGLKAGFEIYRKQTTLETTALQAWATERDIDLSVLKSAEVFAAFPPKIATPVSGLDRELLDSLEAAGLLLRRPVSRDRESAFLPLELPPRDFYGSRRIIFTIRDDRGEITGFVGRAIGEEQPKYLFSPGFPRGSTLYRLDNVRNAQISNRTRNSNHNVIHVFVVEGLMDSLRLEAIGLHSVAILGSQITDKQVSLLTDLANDLDREKRSLAIHLMLDTDDAGRRGAVAATVRLLTACASTPGMLLDVITPHDSDLVGGIQGHDPDELFRHAKNAETALEMLSQWCVSPMTLLLSTAVGVQPTELNTAWKTLSESQCIQAFRDVERRLDRSQWNTILDRVPLFDCLLRSSSSELSHWQLPLRRYLLAMKGRQSRQSESNPENVAIPKNDRSRLIRAIQIAEASTQRREFSIDEGSWDRIQAAIDVTVPHFCELLELESTELKRRTDKMTAVLVPKGNGEFRLKSLPSPEVLSLQQYVLNELLRDYSECPRFQQLIPGVRRSMGSGTRGLETTGPERLRPIGGDTVSFAYTLDMDVIEHRAPPRRTGMFRPYFECWRNFISFIDGRLTDFPRAQQRFFVARLDVRRFYNTVTRPVVNAVLLDAVKDAFAELADVQDPQDPRTCAQLFRPTVKCPEERAEAIVDWLCDQSFGYEFEPPGTVHEDHPGGLPQGPDLSAYLANIAMFPLDRALSEVVADLDRRACAEAGESIPEGQTPSVRGAVYARYVDDIVIIARTGNDLAILRGAVEQQLSLIGMELSPKTDSLPVMDVSGVREWLTDGRGAALGVSGPFEGPPESVPISLLEPLADAGETDRNDSLRILHDPRLADPETTWQELEMAIEVALAAPNLRHGDLACAAQHLWGCVLKQIESGPLDPNRCATVFSEMWNGFAPSHEITENVDEKKTLSVSVSHLLAWLDGIERVLLSRQDRNPAFSSVDHEAVHNHRTYMSTLVHEGLCEILVENALSVDKLTRFHHMLDIKRLVIHRAATLVSRPIAPRISIPAGESRTKARLLISLAEAQGTPKVMNEAWPRVSGMPLMILFHEAVARLRIANHLPALESLDPLMPLKESVRDWQRSNGNDFALATVLDYWMPDPGCSESNTHDKADAALSAFVNLASRYAVQLIDKREALKRFALDGANGSDLRLLPTPPGLDVGGFIGLRDCDNKVVRVRFQSNSVPEFSPSLSWVVKPSQTSAGGLVRDEASLDGRRSLDSSFKSEATPSLTRWLARAFRSLAISTKCNDEGRVCLPTASNLLGPEVGDDSAESQWEALGFCVSQDNVAGQAFLRQGGGGLLLEPVLELNDHLWRVGTALADFLGRALSTRHLSTQRLSAPALILEEGDSWAREAILRFSLCRLRGLGLPARPLRLSTDTGLPTTIERVLRRLEAFPADSTQSQGTNGIVHLVATLAEGRAIQARTEARLDPIMPGGASALLCDMMRGQFRADEELALRLPDSEAPLTASAPMRRPARALYALAERLSVLVSNDPMRTKDTTLQAIASGAVLLSIEMQLRSQALELWSLLDIGTQQRFHEFPPTLSEWRLDSTALLHREQQSSQSGVSKDSENVRELFRRLCWATNVAQHVEWGVIAGVTPLGWVVVLGALTGELSGDWRGGLRRSVQNGLVDKLTLKDLALKLARSSDSSEERGEGDLPWGGLSGVIDDWSITRAQEAFSLLNHLDTVAGLRVRQCQSHHFVLTNNRGRTTEVETSDGRRRLPAWAITWAKAINEVRDGVERVRTSDDEQIVISRWSETWCDDRLVGIGVVQPAMAALAGEAFAISGETASTSYAPPSAGNVAVTQLLPEADNELTFETTSNIPPSTTPEVRRPSIAGPLLNTAIPREAGDSRQAVLSRLEQFQQASWRSRKENPPSHIRVALFQWEVDETYRHPGFDLCNKATSKFNREKPDEWKEHAYEHSCAEHRRRGMLTAALKACGHFGVDILLLPEYSTRPDTVEWLSQQLRELAPSTSVWAGTYRLPPGMVRPTDRRDWSAIHEVVSSENVDGPVRRLKKYPSVAADEVFHPGSSVLEPLFPSSTGDFRGFVYELICSEVFLVTFPANLFPLARLRRELLRKFGNNVRGRDINAMIEEEVMADVKRFGIATAISENLGIRRTVLLVPAMTSRCEDYSVLGQAAFLSSGLTTVFCNAVCARYGHGQSCFIGHDGWLNNKQSTGLPSTTPYHGVEPGLFRLGHENGCLGKEEQALVIADVDPIYGPGGQPRPQTLLKPLRLVAHLPVIESWQSKPGASQSKCRCCRSEISTESDSAFGPLYAAIRRGIDQRWLTTGSDNDPKVLAQALETLAKCSGLPHSTSESSSGWMRERMKAYLSNHLADPNPWPPPVALDWLWVDLGPNDNASLYPRIETPAYVSPPGGESRGV